MRPREVLDPENRRRWRDEKNPVAFPLHSATRPFEAVDLLINVELDFEGAWARREQRTVGEVLVPLLGLADLVALKRTAGRPQDLADAEAIERLAARRGGRRVSDGGPAPQAPARGVLSIPDDEAVDRWLRVPPLERLRWLAEANEFLYLAQPPEVREAWHAFRRGEL